MTLIGSAYGGFYTEKTLDRPPTDSEFVDVVTRVAMPGPTAAWARKRVSLEVADAAELLKCEVAELEKIEAGEASPSASLFRRMSEKYGLAEATLLGPVPLDDRALPRDFRSFDGEPVALSFATAKVCRLVQERQEALQYLSELDGDVVAPTLKILTLQSDPEKEGQKFRKELGFDIVTQFGYGAQKAFIKWRTIVEDLGVSVYVEPLGADGSRGVSIYFNDFPAIVIDETEKHRGARLFTLFHELAHILLRQTGISDQKSGSRVEKYCNRFAAAFLMPPEAVKAALPNESDDEPSIAELDFASRKLCTTISQVALRLEQLGWAKSGYFKRIVSGLHFPKNNKPRSKKNGPPYRYTYLAQYGQHLTKTVLSALDSGSIGTVEAVRILHAAPEHFASFKATIEERRIDPMDAIG